MGKEQTFLIAADSAIVIQSMSDLNEVIAACFGTDGILLVESDFGPAFFDLRSGLAGELFQKFMNYHIRAAIVIPDPAAHGKRFSELAYEHATHNMIRFFRSKGEAEAWLESFRNRFTGGK